MNQAAIFTFAALLLLAVPVQARFLQTDPVGYRDDLNAYLYAHDDPLNGTDPFGTWVCAKCDAKQSRAFTEAQNALGQSLEGKIAVLKSLKVKLANGKKLTPAEQKAAALMTKYLGSQAGNNEEVVDHLLKYASGILAQVRGSNIMNPADGDWPMQNPTNIAELHFFGDGPMRDVMNTTFFEYKNHTPTDLSEREQTIAHETARAAGYRKTGGNNMMNDSISDRGMTIPTQGRDNIAKIAAIGDVSPDDMLDRYADASVSALGY